MDKNNIAIPFAIIVAGLLIAGAVYFGGKKPDTANLAAANNPQAAAKDIAPVTKDDHIIGNPDAKVVVVEYSDLQCPYCQQFHGSMKSVMDTLGKDGKVAWVYRQFPLTQIHPYAEKAAEGAECVAELGGNAKFWEYVDAIFADGAGQATVVADPSALAKSIGIDKTKFDACLASGKYVDKIKASTAEGMGAGVTGTPTSFIVVDGKVNSSIPGVVPADQLKSGIESLLK